MIKTLYDPAVEQRGREIGRQIGIELGIAELLISEYRYGLSIEYIAEISDLDVEYVKSVVEKGRCSQEK